MLIEVMRYTLRYKEKNYPAGSIVEVDDALAEKLLAKNPEDYKALMVATATAEDTGHQADEPEQTPELTELPAVNLKKTVK